MYQVTASDMEAMEKLNTPALPLVHNKEPSIRFALPDTYQSHRVGFDLRGWLASGQLYYRVDEALLTDYLKRWEACRRMSWFARHVDTGEVRVFSSEHYYTGCTILTDRPHTPNF
ncbi:hypothetical protein ES703_111697 [subsurface metagenome]